MFTSCVIRSPRLINFEVSDQYEIPMTAYLENSFDLAEVASFYDEQPFWSSPFGLKLLDKVIYRKGITVLDIGCGTGFPMLELAMRLGSSSVVLGIDPWKEGIERIEQKARFFGLTNVGCIEGVAEILPLEEATVDLIISNNGLNNVQDLDRVLLECSRVMKPDAQMVFTMNTALTMIEFYDVFERVLKDNGLDDPVEAMHRHIRTKRPPVEEVLSNVRASGFEIVETEASGFRYRFTDGSSMLNHYFIRMAFLDSWKNLVPEDRRVPVFEEVERQLNEKASREQGLELGVPFVVVDCRKRR